VERSSAPTTPLYAAIVKGNDEVVKILLERGADINVQCGKYGNALKAAAVTQNAGVVKMLLEGGAIVNIEGGIYGNVLQAAMHSGPNWVSENPGQWNAS
jgi:ankyrin repeat protein